MLEIKVTFKGAPTENESGNVRIELEHNFNSVEDKTDAEVNAFAAIFELVNTFLNNNSKEKDNGKA
jgi:hypothetical protein